jgi:ATP/maltotriose-dependent transcriptional regulator MalT
MLRHVRANIPVDQETHYLMLDRESLLLYELGQVEAAYTLALSALGEADFTSFHAASANLWLCYLAYQRGELDTAAGYARATEHYARQSDRRMALMIAQAWLALFARGRGDEAAALRWYQGALFYKAHLERKPSSMFYEVILAFHQRRAAWDEVAHWHQAHIAEMAATGEIFAECKARLAYCAFLGQRGAPLATALAETQQALRRLRAPQHFAPQLARLTRGDYGEAAP